MSTTAEILFNSKEYHKLELLFSSQLKTSTDFNLYKTYLKYTKQNQHSVNLFDVYDFIFKKLKHHWDIYFFIDNFIDFIRNSSLSDEEKVEKMRKIFHAFFLIPMHSFKELWMEYEGFENDLNKMTAKKVISDILPYYQKTHRLYTLYASNYDYEGPCVQDKFVFEDFYDIVEMEEKNIPVYSSEFLFERMTFIYRFFCQKFQREEAFFLYSEYLIKNNKISEAKEVVKNGIKECENSLFLYCYYGSVFDDHLFEEALSNLMPNDALLVEQNDQIDLLIINYLACMLRNKGLDEFRNVLKIYMSQEIGPGVFIYAAQAEHFTLQNKDLPFRIFTKALQKYPNSTILQKEFLQFLLNTGDIINARAFYDQFAKTTEIDDFMIEFERKFGNYENIRKIEETYTPSKTKAKPQVKRKNLERKYMSFKDSYEYYNLTFHVDDVLTPFVESLKVVNEFKYLKWDKDILIDLLKSIKIIK